MTVAQLIALLQSHPQDLPVLVFVSEGGGWMQIDEVVHDKLMPCVLECITLDVSKP